MKRPPLSAPPDSPAERCEEAGGEGGAGHSLLFLLFFLLFWGTTGCDTRASSLRLQPVVGPTGGDVFTVQVLADSGKVVAPTEFGVFNYDEIGEWQRQPGLGLEDGHTAALRALTRDGPQLNYPRKRLFTVWNGAVWVITRLSGNPALLWSDTAGARWERVKLPTDTDEEEDGEEPIVPSPPASVRAAEPPRLVIMGEDLFLVGTTDIWKFGGDVRDATWRSIGLSGLPAAAQSLPPAIRNYLPRTQERPFEVVTVLTDQLLVFRRTGPEDPWVMTSSLATVDRQLVGAGDSDMVFLVSPDSIQRSDSQGEEWFDFWPEGHPRVEILRMLPRSDLELGFAMIVGGADGSIWMSRDAGATWKQTRAADPDGRAITGIGYSGDATVVWASTLGQGVLRSDDGGENWQPVNSGLRAGRPMDIAFTNDGDLLLGTRAGLFQLAGDPDSGNWVPINSRATSALSVEPISNRLVSGSIIGDITTQAVEGEPVHVPNPFEDKPQFAFVPRSVSRSTVPPPAVVAIAARDDGQRWIAWSREYGATTSDDGGRSWTPLEISDALESALSNTTVTQFVVEPNDTIYLVEENSDSRTPALLWRSEDDGDSWTTIHAFPRDDAQPVTVKPRPPNYPGVLFAADADQFKRTKDGGATWQEISGPWAGQRIIDFSVQEDRAALLIDARRRFEVVVLDGIDAITPTVARHVVAFSEDEGLVDVNDVSHFELHDRRVVLTAGQRMWIGTLPVGRTTVTQGMAMLATIAGAVVLIAFAFLYMRATLLK